MNAMDFFLMSREGRKAEFERQARFMHDLCYVSMLPSLTKESADGVRQMFERRAMSDDEIEENFEFVERVKKHTDDLAKAAGKVLDAGSDAAKGAMMKVFALKRRGQYGR